MTKPGAGKAGTDDVVDGGGGFYLITGGNDDYINVSVPLFFFSRWLIVTSIFRCGMSNPLKHFSTFQKTIRMVLQIGSHV